MIVDIGQLKFIAPKVSTNGPSTGFCLAGNPLIMEGWTAPMATRAESKTPVLAAPGGYMRNGADVAAVGYVKAA